MLRNTFAVRYRHNTYNFTTFQVFSLIFITVFSNNLNLANPFTNVIMAQITYEVQSSSIRISRTENLIQQSVELLNIFLSYRLIMINISCVYPGPDAKGN